MLIAPPRQALHPRLKPVHAKLTQTPAISIDRARSIEIARVLRYLLGPINIVFIVLALFVDALYNVI